MNFNIEYSKNVIAETLSKLSRDTDYQMDVLRVVCLIIFIITCIAVGIYSAEDPNSLSSSTYTYGIIIIISLIIVLTLFIPSILKASSSIQYILLFILFLLFIVGVCYACLQLTSQSAGIINYMLTGLIIIGVIVGLGLLFLVIGKSLKNQEGWIGFFINLIFYVPCLVVDFIKYLTYEFKSTVNYIYILYIIEIVIILLYVYLPKLISYTFLVDGYSIQPEPLFLDTYKSIPLGSVTVQDRIGPNDLTTQNDPIVFRRNFALTMWLYINPQNSIDINSETNIMNFGGGKPKIVYKFDNVTSKMTTYSFKVYFTNTNSDSGYYQFNLRAQKWNFITFNYTSNSVDFFINGKLMYTFQFNDSNLPSFSNSDVIELGSNNGVYGSICNIKYYNEPLTIGQIANSYNLLMFSNPPTM